MPTPDPARATGLADAATAFEGLLTPASERTPRARPAAKTADTDTETQDQSEEVGNDQTEEGAGDDADQSEAAAGETTQEEGDAEGEADDEGAADAEDAADAEGEAQETAEAKPPATVTVKVNGKEEKVSFEEVVRGYQRHADYSQKTQALAAERKILHDEAEQLIQERQQYGVLLPALQKQLEALQEKEPDWDELYNRDPLEYVRQRDLFRDRADRIAAATTERARLENLDAQERQKGLVQTLAQGRERLIEAVPEWKDPKRWEKDRVSLLKFGQKIGFTEAELSQTYDPRAVIALHKAMKYDALMANRPRPVVNKGPRIAPAGSAESVPRPQDRTTQAKKRLSQTGSVKDAAKVFENLI